MTIVNECTKQHSLNKYIKQKPNQRQTKFTNIIASFNIIVPVLKDLNNINSEVVYVST